MIVMVNNVSGSTPMKMLGCVTISNYERDREKREIK